MNYFNCIERKNIYIAQDAESYTAEHHKSEECRQFLVGAALDADGLNYYDFQKTLAGYRYACVIITDSGVVLHTNTDPSIISPGVGQTIFGVNEYPEEMTFDGTWRYDYETETFYHDTLIAEQKALAENTETRNTMLSKATAAAYPLQLRATRGTASPEQLAQLAALDDYIIDLVDMTDEQLSQSPAPFPPKPEGL